LFGFYFNIKERKRRERIGQRKERRKGARRRKRLGGLNSMDS
jgi:hypothetical protein